jgi:Dimerisation domain of Ca+-activated chloride-channel, anoctamin
MTWTWRRTKCRTGDLGRCSGYVTEKRAHGVAIDRGDPDSHLVHHTFLVFVSQEQSLYFQDGERSVDFIIAWDNRTAAANSDVAERRRAFYEGQLAEELHLESDDAEEGCALSFVKIHVPKDVLKKYAEILKVRMPMKEVRRRTLLSLQFKPTINTIIWLHKLI